MELAGYGKIEFAFNIVFWLVLLVRDGLEVIAGEIARHPRLIRPLVDHLLALKGLLALGLLAGDRRRLGHAHGADRAGILSVYGLMLLTTALGLDYVYRGIERMGLVAVSLVLRTRLCGGRVLSAWRTPRDCLGAGLARRGRGVRDRAGLGRYIRRFGVPRPDARQRPVREVVVRRGRPVSLIQMAQAVIGSVDFLIVGLMSHWGDVGLYGARTGWRWPC